MAWRNVCFLDWHGPSSANGRRLIYTNPNWLTGGRRSSTLPIGQKTSLALTELYCIAPLFTDNRLILLQMMDPDAVSYSQSVVCCAAAANELASQAVSSGTQFFPRQVPPLSTFAKEGRLSSRLLRSKSQTNQFCLDFFVLSLSFLK